MNGPVFGRGYSGFYDALYGDKDYAREVDMLEEVFRRHARGAVRTVMDMGCGTGGHAIPLSARGFRVTGVDRSSDMLGRARRKVLEQSPPPAGGLPEFVEGDLREVSLDRKFDAVLMMFAVLGYQLTNEDVQAALRNVRRHLEPGGLFVFDVWYGPAVLAVKPGDRVKVVENGGRKILRAASGTLDSLRHLTEVRYRIWEFEEGRFLGEAEEVHRMRHFFPQELALFLSQAGMDLLGLHPFGDLENPPDEGSWNALAIARSSGG